jgi:hypothetical protein
MSVEVEHVAPADGVVEEDSVALPDVLHHVVPVDENVLGERVAHLAGGETSGAVEGRRHSGLGVVLEALSH